MNTRHLWINLDYHIQFILMLLNTLLWGVGLGSGLVSLFLANKDAMGGLMVYCIILAMYFQMFLGAYQFIFSASVHLLLPSFSGSITKLRAWHWNVSALLLFSFGVIWYYPTFLDRNYWLTAILFMVIPQLLAYTYFFITWKDNRSRKDYLAARPTLFT